ncbi:MAG: hypothetical protein R2941_03220 [Desulfobacterales bacterium]
MRKGAAKPEIGGNKKSGGILSAARLMLHRQDVWDGADFAVQIKSQIPIMLIRQFCLWKKPLRLISALLRSGANWAEGLPMLIFLIYNSIYYSESVLWMYHLTYCICYMQTKSACF